MFHQRQENFLKLMEDCMSGMIDIVMTKSISRFSRNLVDTLQYVRMLKERGVTIIFEKENINTSTMESEMQLAQNEVESLSQNVKMGVKMKMRRGEMMGFNGCLGYDYHPENKSITVNEAEAETVRYIFDRYIEGYGAYTIAKELTALGKVNKKGQIKWTDSGVRGIIKNEKYKGDLLQGKTYTVDPISKRRLDNRGEEDRFYIKDHHEAIVSKEIWDIGELIGVAVSSVAIGAILYLLSMAWGGYGSNDLPAPQAMLMKMIVEGVMGGNLPWNMVFAGVFIAIVVEVLGIPVLPFAIGLYLPIYLSVPMMLGGALRWFLEKRKYSSEKDKTNTVQSGVLYSSGLIAGEGIVGILLAVLAIIPAGLSADGKALYVSDKINLSEMFGISIGNIGGLICFAVILFTIYLFATKDSKKK